MKLQIEKLKQAAVIFSKNPKLSVAELASKVGVSEGAIYRWAKLPEWDEALDELKYEGERKFHRQPRRSLEREVGDTIERAKQLISEGMQQGLTEKKAITHTAEVLNLPRRRIYEWNRRRKGK